MENPPDFYRIMSLRLSRALSDIGVNRWMVRRRRRTFLMLEASLTIRDKVQGLDGTSFHFGSQSEGTTTPGLNSDIDTLTCINDTNIMSSWSEWEAGRLNMLMLKEETCSPQHYLLQIRYVKDGEPARLLPDHVPPPVQGVKRHWRQQVDGEEKKGNFPHDRGERDDR
ncbi:hypothetical protein MAR_037356 [Mya arenaria]|uniref:Uncharacterized protein n=1 Tax=Mya arenaria TaxID=6604 RepID=A0ABY7FPZ2_MYAAR|nr:hypothetical protein MAR_037356 [Mya arenaria]